MAPENDPKNVDRWKSLKGHNSVVGWFDQYLPHFNPLHNSSTLSRFQSSFNFKLCLLTDIKTIIILCVQNSPKGYNSILKYLVLSQCFLYAALLQKHLSLIYDKDVSSGRQNNSKTVYHQTNKLNTYVYQRAITFVKLPMWTKLAGFQATLL